MRVSLPAPATRQRAVDLEWLYVWARWNEPKPPLISGWRRWRRGWRGQSWRSNQSGRWGWHRKAGARPERVPEPIGDLAIPAEQRQVLRQALADAVFYRDPPVNCDGCENPDELCPDCADGLARARSYLALGRVLGTQIPA